MRGILVFAIVLSVLLGAGPVAEPAFAARPGERPTAASQAIPRGAPVKLSTADRAALNELLTFFFRYAGVMLPGGRDDEVLIRLGTAAVFRHYAMDGMETCAPKNDPARDDGFLLSPRCVDEASMRLTGYALATHRSAGDILYTDGGYSVPLPTGEPPVAAVTDRIFRLENGRYRVEGYYLRYPGPAIEENALQSSAAFTAETDRRGRRWRLRALHTTRRPRPVDIPLHALQPEMTRDMLLLLGAVPVDDAQALWISVRLGDTRWRGRVRLRRDKAVSAELKAASGPYGALDGALREGGYAPTELIRGDVRRHSADATWNALVQHFYAALGSPTPEPAQLVYLPQQDARKKDNGKHAAALPKIRVDRGETPSLDILWR